ncbi:MAG TPA: SCO family protein [Chthoniobacterales bacterium]
MKIFAFLFTIVLAEASYGQTLPSDYQRHVGFDQHLGRSLPLDSSFNDESDHAVRLGSLLQNRPAILVLAYYRCPNLCTIVMNGLLDGLRDSTLQVGRDFEVIVVSIDPDESASLASAKKRIYVRQYGRAGAESGWHLLTGNAASIRQLADAVGYRYFYDEASKQFAHPSGIAIISPSGKISQYMLGIEFPPKELDSAIHRAAQDRVGSLSRALLLLCYCYDPATGKYTLAVSRVMQVAGSLTVLGLCGMILLMNRRPRSKP